MFQCFSDTIGSNGALRYGFDSSELICLKEALKVIRQDAYICSSGVESLQDVSSSVVTILSKTDSLSGGSKPGSRPTATSLTCEFSVLRRAKMAMILL